MPRKAPPKGEPTAISLFVPADVRAKLDASAKTHHRSLTKEVASRLEESFVAETSTNRELFDSIGKLIRALESRTDTTWQRNVYVRTQLLAAISELVGDMGAQGSAEIPTLPKLPTGMDKDNLGQWLAQSLVMFGEVK
jgi:hypothetical protein